jgi:hypothetical protein
MKFYVTSKSNPSLLVTTLEIKGLDLLSKKAINFSSEEERNLNSISIYVYPEFDSYGLLKNDDD